MCVFSDGFSLVSCIVTILGFSVVMSSASSVILLRMPLMFSCIILKSLGLVVVSPEVVELDDEEEGEEVLVDEVVEEGEDSVGDRGWLSVVDWLFVESLLVEWFELSCSVVVEESEVVETSLLIFVSWSV